MKLAAMGLALKDSPPGFIPTSIESYDEGYETDAYQGFARVLRRRVQRDLLPGDRAARRTTPDGGEPAVRRGSPGRHTGQYRSTLCTPCSTHRLCTTDAAEHAPPGGLRKDRHAHPHQGSPSRRRPRARKADAGQPGHLAVRARADHHDRGEGKAARPLAEKLVTFAKRGDLHARRQVMTTIRDKSVVTRCSRRSAPASRTARRLHGSQGGPQGRQRPHGGHRAGRGADRLAAGRRRGRARPRHEVRRRCRFLRRRRRGHGGRRRGPARQDDDAQEVVTDVFTPTASARTTAT